MKQYLKDHGSIELETIEAAYFIAIAMNWAGINLPSLTESSFCALWARMYVQDYSNGQKWGSSEEGRIEFDEGAHMFAIHQMRMLLDKLKVIAYHNGSVGAIYVEFDFYADIDRSREEIQAMDDSLLKLEKTHENELAYYERFWKMCEESL